VAQLSTFGGCAFQTCSRIAHRYPARLALNPRRLARYLAAFSGPSAFQSSYGISGSTAAEQCASDDASVTFVDFFIAFLVCPDALGSARLSLSRWAARSSCFPVYCHEHSFTSATHKYSCPARRNHPSSFLTPAPARFTVFRHCAPTTWSARRCSGRLILFLLVIHIFFRAAQQTAWSQRGP
jgi:hypothetical protein